MSVQPSQQRREFAEQFGAHHVVNPVEADVIESTKKFTNGEGIDVCFDAAGAQVAVDSGLKCLKAKATFVNIALWGDQRVALEMIDMIFGELRYMAGECFSSEVNSKHASDRPTISHYLRRWGLRRSYRCGSRREAEAAEDDNESYPTRRSRRTRVQGIDRR